MIRKFILLGLLISAQINVANAENDTSIFLDSDCDNFLENRAGFIIDPGQADNDMPSTLKIRFGRELNLSTKIAADIPTMSLPKTVGLQCFTLPKVIEALQRPSLQLSGQFSFGISPNQENLGRIKPDASSTGSPTAG